MLVPAIHFPGNCAEAIALYEAALGAKVINIAHYRDAPADSDMRTEHNHDQVMHAELTIGDAPINMCDVAGEVSPGNMHVLNVFLSTGEEVAAAYHRLAEGGRVFTPLGPQFWAPMYADFEDRFGIHWQLMAEG